MIAEMKHELIQETPQLVQMKARYPSLKQQLQQPFPHFYQICPKYPQLFQYYVSEVKRRLKENPNILDLGNLVVVIMGKIQGMPGYNDLKSQLTKLFEYQNKDFWNSLIREKASLKYYGLSKQKSHSIYQIKDIQQLKQFYQIDQICRKRSILKQYSKYYKNIHKFIQKYQKLKCQQQIINTYEQYKKIDKEQLKMNQLLSSQHNIINNSCENLTSTNKIQNIIEINCDLSKDHKECQQEKKIQDNNSKLNKKIENKEEKVKSPIKKEVKSPIKKEVKKTNNNLQNKEQNKEQNSAKKQNKASASKQQQITTKCRTLDMFLTKKKPQIQQSDKVKQRVEEPPIIIQKQEDKTDIFLQTIDKGNGKNTSLQKLKSQFISTKHPNKEANQICYINIVLTKSRLQYYDFPIKQNKANFNSPFDQKDNIRYDDSSDQYSQLVADSINQQMVQQESQEEEQEEFNSAIVSDNFFQYKSGHMVSSQNSKCIEEQKKIKPQLITKQMGKWQFSFKQSQKQQKFAKYEMVSLVDDLFPIIVKDQVQDKNNELTPTQKIQMYKQIHGSFTPKQILIKKLTTIVQNKLSMNKLSTLIKDISQKKGSQRIIKLQVIHEIVQQMNEINSNLQKQLQQLRIDRQIIRNQQIEARKEQKNNQRDQKIQKYIIQYQGIKNINNIFQYLKNNQIKIHKQQLNTLIVNKQGIIWESIRNQIQKNKIAKANAKQKIKIKIFKANKVQLIQSNLKNCHRPIYQIMKQNQIYMANHPKKNKNISKEIDQSVINQGQIENQHHSQSIQNDDNDESYKIKKKTNKKHKKKKKLIVKISAMPTRRNPKRNKKKISRQNEIQEEQKQNSDNANEEIQKNQENKSKSEEMREQNRSKSEEEMGDQNSPKKTCNKSEQMIQKPFNKGQQKTANKLNSSKKMQIPI